MDDDFTKEADPETKRLVNLVKVTLRILGLSNREVARRLGMSPSYLSKLLSGAADLRLDHVVRICKAADMEPAEFFGLAYPLSAPRTSVTQNRLREMLQGLVPVSPPPPPPPQAERTTEKEIHDMLRAALERLTRGNGGT
ncbi:MAG TPA: helix-turn-helix transcriptional regulator [Thermoanaerobaculia bacterium]|jgi:transcriptional regulator with XRE-family HTH domain